MYLYADAVETDLRTSQRKLNELVESMNQSFRDGDAADKVRSNCLCGESTVFVAVTTACLRRRDAAACMGRKRHEPGRAISLELLTRGSARPFSACTHTLLLCTATLADAIRDVFAAGKNPRRVKSA